MFKKIAAGWIRTTDLRWRKRLLYQLSQNHCPRYTVFALQAPADEHIWPFSSRFISSRFMKSWSVTVKTVWYLKPAGQTVKTGKSREIGPFSFCSSRLLLNETSKNVLARLKRNETSEIWRSDGQTMIDRRWTNSILHFPIFTSQTAWTSVDSNLYISRFRYRIYSEEFFAGQSFARFRLYLKVL